MLDESGFPSTLDPTDMNRRLTGLERQIALDAGSRSLTASTIGNGGLRVYGGGSIRVEDEGSLIVETGNLVLGGGIIQGSALKEQIATSFEADSNTSFAIATAWGRSLSIVVARPAWATRTVVACQATVTLPTYGSIRGYLTGPGSTLDINTVPRESRSDSTTVASLAWGGVTTAASITAAIDTRVFYIEPALTSRRADLQVVCTFMR